VGAPRGQRAALLFSALVTPPWKINFIALVEIDSTVEAVSTLLPRGAAKASLLLEQNRYASFTGVLRSGTRLEFAI
jgi:hypothetical protein